MDARCDGCGADFTPDLVDRPDGRGGAVREFRCPSCGHVYPVARISAKGLRIQRDLQHASSPGARDRLRAELEPEVRRP